MTYMPHIAYIIHALYTHCRMGGNTTEQPYAPYHIYHIAHLYNTDNAYKTHALYHISVAYPITLLYIMDYMAIYPSSGTENQKGGGPSFGK